MPEQEVTTAVQNNFNIATLNDVDSDAFKTLYGSEDDTTIDVVFDGVSYQCRWAGQQDGPRVPAFGNLAISNPSVTDTGEPFCVTPGPKDTFVIGCKVAGTHTVAVSYQQDVVHTLDPKYIGHIDPALFANVDSDNDTFAIPFTKEFAAGKWAEDYSYFVDKWLTDNFGADISLEINGKLFEHLPFSTGSVGAFTYGDLDTIGVAIVNSGYGTSTQRVEVSATLFPDGVKSARVFRTGVYAIAEDVLPASARWVTEYTAQQFVLVSDTYIFKQNAPVSGEAPTEFTVPSIDENKVMVVIDNANGYLTPKVTLWVDGTQVDATMILNNGDAVTQDMIPDRIALVGRTKNNEAVLLNPKL